MVTFPLIRTGVVMRMNRKGRITLIITAVLLFIAAAGGGYYVLRTKYISNNGIKLTPTRDFEIRSVAYYLQNDSAWADDKIGETSQTLGGAGCLITCAASSITDLGIDMTPAALNKKLSDVSGFQGANLIWYKIHEAVPEINYTYSRIFSAKTIENDLEQGRLPIVNVKYRGSGVTHWVVIIGAEDNDFMIYDPLGSAKEPIPLSTHGNVYSYRVLQKQ